MLNGNCSASGFIMDTTLDYGCVAAFIQLALFDTELGGHSCGWMGKSNTEMAKQFLKQACNFCSLFEQLAWVHLPKPVTVGLPRRYMPDVIFLTLGLSAAEWISL